MRYLYTLATSYSFNYLSKYAYFFIYNEVWQNIFYITSLMPCHITRNLNINTYNHNDSSTRVTQAYSCGGSQCFMTHLFTILIVLLSGYHTALFLVTLAH